MSLLSGSTQASSYIDVHDQPPSVSMHTVHAIQSDVHGKPQLSFYDFCASADMPHDDDDDDDIRNETSVAAFNEN